jgi:lipopolysaccharide biosynthesis glycosyltransferase
MNHVQPTRQPRRNSCPENTCGDKKQGPIHVFFNANDAFVPHLSVAIASILKTSKSALAFHILTSDLTEISRKNVIALCSIRPFDIEFLQVDKNLFNNVDRSNLGNLSMEAYYRLSIADLCPQIDRAIYLDCDLVVNRDLRELWDIDIGGNFCGGISDAHSYAPGMVEKIFGREFYFNSGVLLLNLFEIRKHFSLGDFLRIKRENLRWFRYNDQDIFNKAFGSRVVELPGEWNVTGAKAPGWVAGQIARMSLKKKKYHIKIPAIMHYTGAHKPWREPHGINSHFFGWLYFHNLRETLYADMEKDMRGNYNHMRPFLRYWWRHPLFFMKIKFWRRMYYKHMADASEIAYRKPQGVE